MLYFPVKKPEVTPRELRVIAAKPLFVEVPAKVTAYFHPKAEPNLDQMVWAILDAADQKEGTGNGG